MEILDFWHQRASHYDKLFWTKDKGYLDAIVKAAKFKKGDLVLDVGVGTGAVAKKIRPFVKHVVGIDISESMLEKGAWEGISAVKWDIRDALFNAEVFDKVIARMCFHHITENLDLAIKRCSDLLKPRGKIVVAEGLAPVDTPEVLNWYRKMFALKEERLVFTEKELKTKLLHNGFKKVATYMYRMHSFSVKNWLVNSGLAKVRQVAIMKLHMKADQKVKDAYNMRCLDDDCLIDTRNVIFVAEKK